MTNKAMKYGLMTIAAVLLVAMAFAGAGAAVDVEPAQATNPSVIVMYENGTTYLNSSLGTVYLIENEENWRYVVNHSELWDKTFVLTDNIEFDDSVDSIGNSTTIFKGNIYGNSFKISNFTQFGSKAKGLIGAGVNCTLNYVQLTNCLINSTTSGVGAFMGTASAPTSNGGFNNFCGCSIDYADIIATGCTGAIFGDSSSSAGVVNINITSCRVNHVYIYGYGTSAYDYCIGGLGGRALSSKLIVIDTIVENSEIGNRAWNNNGGLFGWDGNSLYMRNTTLKNCKVWAGIYNLGGFVGKSQSAFIVDGCKVENCSICCLESAICGGLFGSAYSADWAFSGNTTWVNNTWIFATGTVGSTVAYSGCDYSSTTQLLAHSMVYGNMANTSIRGIDNRFDACTDVVDAALHGVGSTIDTDITIDGVKQPKLVYGKDYGYITNIPPTTYSVTVTNGTADVSQASEGTVVTISTDYVKPGYHIEKVPSYLEISMIYKYQFVMPHCNVDVAFEPNMYNVSFSPNNGSALTENQTFVYDVEQALNQNTFTNGSDYVFGTWNTESDGMGTMYSNGATVKNLNTTNKGITMLYAQWAKNESAASGEIILTEKKTPVTKVNVTTSGVTGMATFPEDAPEELPAQISGYYVTLVNEQFNLTVTDGEIGAEGNYTTVYFNVTDAELSAHSAQPADVRLTHFNSTTNTWDQYIVPTYLGKVADNHTFSAKVDSFSIFSTVILTAIPPAYTPSSSSRQTGSTVILQEGQTAPTAYATATPTVAPTVKPTQAPATPTVIATEKPTTQPTQQSPAPFVGILAGLGAAAVLLRLRK